MIAIWHLRCANQSTCGVNLWRGSLLPLDCAAVPCFCRRAASRPSGTVRRFDKLPRHRIFVEWTC
ncbi:hypothetical protein F7R05_02320 [Pseudomonas koreensis]|nr:hypothetical protein F7R05_02320 [Pseudomonas koreensis]